MTDEEKIDLDALRVTALRAGLNLSDEELTELAVGIQRNDAYADAMRRSLAMTTEPAVTFAVSDETQSGGDRNE